MPQDLARQNRLLKWQEMFAVGHQGLDAEHQRLIGIINQIQEAEAAARTPQHLMELANRLYLAAMEHFRHENSLMRDILTGAYLPLADRRSISEAFVNEHCAEHANALIELETLLRSFVFDQGASLAACLRDWFVDHAVKHDSQLRRFFQSD